MQIREASDRLDLAYLNLGHVSLKAQDYAAASKNVSWICRFVFIISISMRISTDKLLMTESLKHFRTVPRLPIVRTDLTLLENTCKKLFFSTLLISRLVTTLDCVWLSFLFGSFIKLKNKSLTTRMLLICASSITPRTI